MLSVHRGCVKHKTAIASPPSGFIAKRYSGGHDSPMIVQILKVFDILAIFEEESWLPTDLTLAQPYLPANKEAPCRQENRPPRNPIG